MFYKEHLHGCAMWSGGATYDDSDMTISVTETVTMSCICDVNRTSFGRHLHKLLE